MIPLKQDPRTHTLEMVREKMARATVKTDGCWLWGAYITHAGYGMVAVPKPLFGTKQLVAHRVAWILENGPIPDGLFVCHHCDTRPCVRPDHLFLGTHDDNMADMVKKGRARNPNAKLTEAQVIDVRRRTRDGETSRTLADEMGVTTHQIREIVKGHRWRRVEAAP